MRALPFDLSPLIPPSYTLYRPLLADALGFFLARLPAGRREGILGEQALLPPDTSLAQRLTLLLRRCPTLHKLGQVLARDRRLDPELRCWLQTLESLPPPPLGRAFWQRLDAELPELRRSGVQVATTALAEASVALVVPFTYPGIPSQGATAGVLKVLKPGVAARLDQELGVWQALGTFLDQRCEAYHLPPIPYGETLESVGRLLANEVRLDQEQRHLAEAADCYRGTGVRVPCLLPFCTPRVTAMERIHGVKVTKTRGLSPRGRRGLAGRIIAGLVARPLWDQQDRSLFHADPHAGNLLHTSEGTLAVLDWSLIGRLDKRAREHLVQALLAAWCLDRAGIARALSALLTAPPREAELRALVEGALARLGPGQVAGFRWLLDLLDTLALTGVGRFESSLLLFRKSLLTLEGVLADVCAEDLLESMLLWSGGWQLLGEWGLRAWAPPGSRAFGSHLSTLDLLSLCWVTPAIGRRYWRRWVGL